MSFPIDPLISFASGNTILLYVFTFIIPICIIGVFNNIANILVFYKMGFSSPSNTTLFCLAISDLLTLCFILNISVGNHSAFRSTDLIFSMRGVSRLAVSLYYSSSALRSWVTALINMEVSHAVLPSPSK